MREVLFWSREFHCGIYTTLDWRPKSTLREMAGDPALGRPRPEESRDYMVRMYVRHPLVVESAISIVRVGYAPAVWEIRFGKRRATTTTEVPQKVFEENSGDC
jgi:hypothetical protein